MQENGRFQGKKGAANRTVKITLRLTPEEAAWLKNDSWQDHQSQAEYIRSRVFAKRSPQVPSLLKACFAQRDYEINRIGNNINQLTRSTHGRRYMTDYESQQLQEAMRAIVANEKLLRSQIESLVIYGSY